MKVETQKTMEMPFSLGNLQLELLKLYILKTIHFPKVNLLTLSEFIEQFKRNE